jgi:hypothetical protein
VSSHWRGLWYTLYAGYKARAYSRRIPQSAHAPLYLRAEMKQTENTTVTAHSSTARTARAPSRSRRQAPPAWLAPVRLD